MVGLGGIGQRHLRNLRTLLGDQVEIMAWRTRRLGHVLTDQLTILSGANLESYYAIQVFSALDEALAQEPDVVFVTNPSSLHMPVALAAAEAGCHLFIEKPLSHSLAGVDRLVEMVEQRNLVTLVGYQLHFHPCLRLAKELLDKEAIGLLLAARLEVGEYLPGWHTYEDYRQMYASRRDLGGGVILSQIHELDLVYWLFGMPCRVFALGGHWSSLEIDVEDTASILLECQYAGRPLPVHVQQDYVQRPPSRTCQIVGDKGKILVDLHALEVHVIQAETSQADVHRFEGFQRNQIFLDELSHFLSCLRGEEEPVVNVRDGAQSLRIALAAHRSIETGEVVTL
jgi:predicted dehydrogenase